MSKKSEHDDAVKNAAERLFGLIERTRFRNPGTSADPYVDALILWLSVITEVREIVAPVAAQPEDALGHIESLYRAAVGHWLAGDAPVDDPCPTDDYLTHAELKAAFREALDPPPCGCRDCR